ncbi:MAG TPA: hypothetical protein VK993_10200 [Chthoniobacterales bacterium]|nr:hypothetical protein [Chthoniobacterales bacterium]
MSSATRRNVAALAVLVIGLLQMAGEACGSRTLKGLGAATVAAPSPKVFCDVTGLEAFASTFTLSGETRGGVVFEARITPELYAHLTGPYNRRNAYGAALSFAPRLPEPMWRSVAQYGLRKDGPLRREIKLPDDIARVRIRIETQTRGRDDVWEFDVPLE